MTVQACIINGVRCTKCCEAIHIPRKAAHDIWTRDATTIYVDQQLVRAKWIPISKRRAKKINPYMFSTGESYQDMAFFKCKSLTKMRCGDYDNRPRVCRSYGEKGGSAGMYSPDCNIFLVSGD